MIQILCNLYVKQESLDTKKNGLYTRPYGTVLVLVSCNFRNTILMNIFAGLSHNILKKDWDFNFYGFDSIEEALFEVVEQKWVEIPIGDVPNGSKLVRFTLDSLNIQEELK